ncbi:MULTISPECIES: AMP-binding protein [unclassified Anaeromyxobacter]|uniref:AMP-binding protein n=1 Tax=unclassified Anaeromyxobacter TaxID=2620896 RepID=UPI001F5A15E3|nr:MULTISPECIES: AMP-binding protein [unclassified Anaeromyxobacter]
MRLVGPPAPAPRSPTLAHALRAAVGHPSGVTFVDLHERERTLRWAEVADRAERVAAALAARGVAPGDRVAIVLRTEPAFLDAFFGAWLAGAVPVPLYPPVRLGRMEEYLAQTARMLEVSGARLVVSSGAVRRLLGGAIARAAPPLGCADAAELSQETGRLSRASEPEALALVQFSSGSTVDPKPVALTHAALEAQVDALVERVRPDANDALVSWLPLYHDMGLIGCLLAAMSYPGRLVLIAPEHFLARPALWLRAIARHQGTISVAPSFAYAYCADRVKDAELAGLSLGSWRLALDGAEPVSAEAMRRFAARFGPHGLDPAALVPVYGLSEAALAVTFSPRGRPLEGRRVDPARLARDGTVAPGPRELVSVGPPIAGVEVEIRDEDGALAGEGRLGRVFVRGPSLMQGYLGDPAATRRALSGGWLDTGDLGFALGGELYVHGRAKDVVIVRGANHAPDEFEAALAGVAAVRPGCAVAVGFVPLGEGDGEGGEALAILAERARGARDDPAAESEIRRAVLERTAIAPHTVRLLEPGTLPRTSSGKLRRGEALRRFLAGTLVPPRRATTLRLALALLRGELALAQARVRRRRPA